MKDERKTKKQLISELRELREKKLNTIEDVPEKNEEWCRTVIEAGKDGIVAIDERGVITMFNPAAEEIFGYEKEDLLGLPLDLLMPPYNRGLHRQYVKNYFSTGKPSRAIGRTLDLPALHSNGKIFPIELSLSSGKIKEEKFVLAIIRDITERKKSEEQLRLSENKFRAVFESAGGAIFIADIESGKILDCNILAERLIGYKRSKIIGMHQSELHPKSEESKYREKFFCHSKKWQTMDFEGKVFNRLTGREVPVWIASRRMKMDDKDVLMGLFIDITKSKKAEEKLRESELKYKTLYDSSRDAIMLLTPREGFFSGNPATVEMFGCCNEEEFISQTPDSLSPKYQPDGILSSVKAQKMMAIAMKKGSHFFEWKHKKIRGEEFYATVLLNRIEVREEIVLQATVRDITVRKEGEEELRRSREFLNNIINALDDPVFVKDEEHRWVLLNDAFCRLAKRSREDLIEKTDLEIFPGEQANVFLERDRQVFETGETSVNEEEIKREGDLYRISIKKSVFTDSLTEKKFIAGTIRDITERRKAEEERLLLATAIEQAAECIIITDKDAIIQYINPAFKKITGYTQEEMLGKKPDILKKNITDIWKSIKGGHVWSGPFINRKKDGSSYDVEATISPVRDGENNITNYILIKRDITQEVRLERRLRQAQKMEAIGTLAGGIAHDFNNILMAILGYTALLMRDIPEGTAPYGKLKHIIKAGNRAGDLVKQILAFSRQSEEEKKLLQISPIIKEALKLLRSSLPSTIEIRKNIKAKSTIIMADPTQVHQVLMNLCTNAGYAMRETGGVMEVILEDVEITHKESDLYKDLKPGPYLKLSVRDTGCGIIPSVMERIFEPYFTTKKQGEGTGMGLAVVHGIVKSHGGEIIVYSEPGVGTAFYVYFPSLKSDMIMEKKEEEVIPGGTERILFVDDEKDLVHIWKEILEDLGYEVIIKTDVFDVLEVFRKDPDRFDLVITDQTMPHMTGIELAKVLMSIRPDIPIILCSGFSELINGEQALAMGIKEFILKPFDIKAIAKIIRDILK